MTRIMLIVSACVLATSLACGKTESAPAKPAAPAAPAAKAPPAAPAQVPAAAPAAAAAPAVAADAAAKPINANCPIGGEPVTADGGTATYKGKTIGFCCPKCAPKFEALDDAGKMAALAKNGTKLPE